jgi:hypothetical protein
MKWVLLVAVALAAVIAVNAALLSYGGERHDPVGQLSPVATMPVPTSTTRTTTIPPTTTSEHRGHYEDD